MGCTSSKAAAPARPAEQPKKPAAPSPPRKLGDNSLGKLTEASSGSLRYNMLSTFADPLEALYEIHNLLGDGALGCVVRRVVRKRDKEIYACKTFSVSPDQTKKEQQYMLGMLKNEVELMRSLDHPNILRIFEVLETPISIHIVMELCTGGDLGRRFYTEVEACRVVRKILRAISFCHERGVCHRDLKVENILWESREPDAELKLIDFGMSRRFHKNQHMTERVGTIYCMAPEVLYGDYTERCDMWSIGCIAFHIITGVPPFEQATEEETIKQLVAVKYAWPSHPKMPISMEAKHFVYHLLRYDPEKRWSAVDALASPWLAKHKTQNDIVDSRLSRPSLAVHAVESLRRFKGYGPLKKTALMVVAYNSNPQRLADLRRLFVKYDVERNGVLSAQEMGLALREFGLSDEEAAAIHKGADVDRSGSIHYLEFLAATIEAYGEVTERQIEETFRRLDLDQSGGISQQNLKDMLGDEFEPSVLEQMVKEAAVNEKGEVNLESFTQLMKMRQGDTAALLHAERGQLNMLRTEATNTPRSASPVLSASVGPSTPLGVGSGSLTSTLAASTAAAPMMPELENVTETSEQDDASSLSSSRGGKNRLLSLDGSSNDHAFKAVQARVSSGSAATTEAKVANNSSSGGSSRKNAKLSDAANNNSSNSNSSSSRDNVDLSDVQPGMLEEVKSEAFVPIEVAATA